MSEKLNSKIAAEFLKLKEDGNLYHRESQFIEFKESFNLKGLADYFRDFSAFANNKGGYLIFGVKDRPKRELVGLSSSASEQFDKIDPEKISGYLLDIFSSNIQWEHELYEFKNMNFGFFYIYEAVIKPIICKKDEGKDQILKNGEVYFRYGGRTQKIQSAELESIIQKRIEQTNHQWMDLVQKIGKSGPQNAAILDSEKGIIEKGNNQILVVDENLLSGFQIIKEGQFAEKKGAMTLKLVGDITPINQVEVIKKVREDKLKEYPLSAEQLATEIKRRLPNSNKNRIWEIIKEIDLKNNKDYSDYSFRNQQQRLDYEERKILAKGVPSIYKLTAVGLLVKMLTNE
ncbi:ATP-binding protein [Sediminibacterium sp.]|uniref:ATP-binding protein n=1 Tax=Sediminibacterium sp. TaxID=1917865 RepID=UPI003F727A0C